MKRIIAACVGLVFLSGVFVLAADPVTAKVTGQRVNMRARPDAKAEVAGQASEGDVLTVKSIQGEWIEVVPPQSVELWVHQDFIQDAKSTVDKLNVRAGPGINYNVVGTLGRGEAVTVKGQFNDWVRIAPFPAASLWVSKEFVQLTLPVKRTPPPAPVVVPKPPPPVVAAVPPVVAAPRPAPAPAPPPDLVLIPLEGQGKAVVREGELKPAPYVMKRPAAYRLISRTGNRIDTVCYLRGNSDQLDSLMGQRLVVRGREYWTQGVREAIVVIEGIETRPSP